MFVRPPRPSMDMTRPSGSRSATAVWSTTRLQSSRAETMCVWGTLRSASNEARTVLPSTARASSVSSSSSASGSASASHAVGDADPRRPRRLCQAAWSRAQSAASFRWRREVKRCDNSGHEGCGASLYIPMKTQSGPLCCALATSATSHRFGLMFPIMDTLCLWKRGCNTAPQRISRGHWLGPDATLSTPWARGRQWTSLDYCILAESEPR